MAIVRVLVFVLVLGIFLETISAEQPEKMSEVITEDKNDSKDFSTGNMESDDANDDGLSKLYQRFKEVQLIYHRRPCINLGDDGCINGIIPGSASDGGYLTGANNPGK